MRIGIIAHLKYPIAEPFAGGLEMHTHLLARSLRARGHAVRIGFNPMPTSQHQVDVRQRHREHMR